MTRRFEDAVPRNIETLTITDDLFENENWGWDEHAVSDRIRTWLADWRTHTPSLRKVTLWLKWADVTWHLPMRNELKQQCTADGVELEIVKEMEDLFMY